MLTEKIKKLLFISMVVMLTASVVFAEGQQEAQGQQEPQELLFTEGANVWQASLSSPVADSTRKGFGLQ